MQREVVSLGAGSVLTAGLAIHPKYRGTVFVLGRFSVCVYMRKYMNTAQDKLQDYRVLSSLTLCVCFLSQAQT